MYSLKVYTVWCYAMANGTTPDTFMSLFTKFAINSYCIGLHGALGYKPRSFATSIACVFSCVKM